MEFQVYVYHTQLQPAFSGSASIRHDFDILMHFDND